MRRTRGGLGRAAAAMWARRARGIEARLGLRRLRVGGVVAARARVPRAARVVLARGPVASMLPRWRAALPAHLRWLARADLLVCGEGTRRALGLARATRLPARRRGVRREGGRGRGADAAVVGRRGHGRRRPTAGEVRLLVVVPAVANLLCWDLLLRDRVVEEQTLVTDGSTARCVARRARRVIAHMHGRAVDFHRRQRRVRRRVPAVVQDDGRRWSPAERARRRAPSTDLRRRRERDLCGRAS